MDISLYGKNKAGISHEEIAHSLKGLLSGRSLRNVLIIPPDFTRFHSNAGFITCFCCRYLAGKGCEVDVLPALGTHEPVSKEEADTMFPDVPFEKLITHDWRRDVVKLGEVPSDFMSEITEGLWNEPVSVEMNRRVLDPKYDLILSIGQVVPHEVIGMANHSKNLFVGVGGSDMINKSHMVGAVYGMERMMGRDFSPVRRMFDYAAEKYLSDLPIQYILTVTTAPEGVINTHGLFMGDERSVLEKAIALSQNMNIDFVETGLKKCVVYLDPDEFKSTWLGNKAVYRTRMVMAPGSELIVLAPGVKRFGEDSAVDSLIRKYGYCGRLEVLKLFRNNNDLQENMGAAAHLIHGSSDGKFTVTYAVKNISKEEIESVNFIAADYDETIERYNPDKLKYGTNTLPDGEEVFFIPNPALGLWIDKSSFDG